MRHDDPHNANRPQWHQINIQFDDHQTAERAVIAHLGPALMEAESTGLVISWFFIRKQWWRFRYMPTSGTSAGEAKKLLADAARSMRDSGYASRWVESIYEPETHAFGGEEGMAAAHNLFHADSRQPSQRYRPGYPPRGGHRKHRYNRPRRAAARCPGRLHQQLGNVSHPAGRSRVPRGLAWRMGVAPVG